MNHIDSNRYSRLIVGLFLCSLGTAFSLHAGMGLSPWSVFHQGLSATFGISFGQASIITGAAVIILSSSMGLDVGAGTILNMILTGVFVDVFEYFGMMPDAMNLSQGTMMILISILFNAIGSYFYMGCEMGCGPRDGLMSILTCKIRLPVGLVRFMIEGSVLLTGKLMGGQVGPGTVLYVAGIGIFVNVVYSSLNFDVKRLHHQSIREIIQGGKA